MNVRKEYIKVYLISLIVTVGIFLSIVGPGHNDSLYITGIICLAIIMFVITPFLGLLTDVFHKMFDEAMKSGKQ